MFSSFFLFSFCKYYTYLPLSSVANVSFDGCVAFLDCIFDGSFLVAAIERVSPSLRSPTAKAKTEAAIENDERRAVELVCVDVGRLADAFALSTEAVLPLPLRATTLLCRLPPVRRGVAEREGVALTVETAAAAAATSSFVLVVEGKEATVLEIQRGQ